MLVAFTFALLFGHKHPMTIRFFSLYSWGIVTLITSVVTVFFILDLYSLHKLPDRFITQILYITLGLFFSAIAVTFIFFFFRNTVPRAVFILFYVFSLVLITTFRYYFNKLNVSLIFWRVLIVGDGKPSEKVVNIIHERKYLHSQIVGYLSDDREKTSSMGPRYLGNIDQLLSIVERFSVDHVIVSASRITEQLTIALLDCMKRKVKVTDFKRFIETVAGKVPIDYLNAGWFFEELSTIDKRYYWYVKRAIDVLLSLFGICVTLPFLPFVALLIKIDSPGPVFYSQSRIGRDNKPFRLWKLRTMVRDADKDNVHWTTNNDARITLVGKFLRKIRLDEVPQLFNILKGDMTLIGPRPEAVSLVELYKKEIPYYLERHMVTPGITGWAQINYPYGNSVEDAREKLKYDYYYIKNRSIVLDANIFLRTIRIVLTGKGAL
jgi:exopolysaccharide biosynthesis polyprenyl glycosylphosphotransferase